MLMQLLMLVLMYFMLKSSLHPMKLLLYLEFATLSCLLFIVYQAYSWVLMLILLLLVVCVGTYGITLVLSLIRSKSFSYFLSS